MIILTIKASQLEVGGTIHEREIGHVIKEPGLVVALVTYSTAEAYYAYNFKPDEWVPAYKPPPRMDIDVHSNVDGFAHENVTVSRSKLHEGNVVVDVHNPEMGIVSVNAAELIAAIKEVSSHAGS